MVPTDTGKIVMSFGVRLPKAIQRSYDSAHANQMSKWELEITTAIFPNVTIVSKLKWWKGLLP